MIFPLFWIPLSSNWSYCLYSSQSGQNFCVLNCNSLFTHIKISMFKIPMITIIRMFIPKQHILHLPSFSLDSSVAFRFFSLLANILELFTVCVCEFFSHAQSYVFIYMSMKSITSTQASSNIIELCLRKIYVHKTTNSHLQS